MIHIMKKRGRAQEMIKKRDESESCNWTVEEF